MSTDLLAVHMRRINEGCDNIAWKELRELVLRFDKDPDSCSKEELAILLDYSLEAEGQKKCTCLAGPLAPHRPGCPCYGAGR